MATLFRKLTNKKLAGVHLSGKVLDLGSSRGAEYHKLFKGDYEITTVNFSADRNSDMVLDLEKTPFPIGDGQFDVVLLINVLEHIYNFNALIKEVRRILRSDGSFVVIVPFLHQIHPSPHDYFRYTKESLEKIMLENGFFEVRVDEIGGGAFGAAYNMLQRFFPFPLDFVFEKIAVFSDYAMLRLSALLGKKYGAAEYPLGYLVRARKSA